ncbi:probable sucrose-phosphatase 2 [Selaginella moellendorffii]|uniref:probable sucrose-phosphatase 2 n=1 Tax=Selaginella moellendorffii TaxID=88036 RepID=UPI000D1D0F3A|nr:probable sucrose-phosphatase 2 [Selaginella moellendorffii]|eukprot:XP_024514777.1 probable sucrose-phosphatase 2 [Selaginella moellendorffii]
MNLSSSPRLMIVSDLDHTMVDHHDPENKSLLRFNALWAAEFSHDSLLVFSTGRSPTLYKELRREKPLLTPGITILSVGTEIMYGDSMIPDSGWEHELDKGWDRSIVMEVASEMPQLTFQSATEQRPHKVSFSVDRSQAPEIMKVLDDRLKARGLEVKLIHSGGQDLDVLPIGASKGHALSYLLKKFEAEGKSPLQTMVCGDSGNDAELFAVPGVYGSMVGNAMEELINWYNENARDNQKIFRATETCASGIIQGLQHFGIDPCVSPRDLEMDGDFVAGHKDGHQAIAREIVLHQLLCEKWLKGEVECSDHVFEILKAPVAPDSTLIGAWGVDIQLANAIEMLRPLHGLHKDKRFWIWVDRIRVTNIGKDTWLAKFDKWQHYDGELNCRITTAIFQSPGGKPYATAIQIQETWKEGYAGKPLLKI